MNPAQYASELDRAVIALSQADPLLGSLIARHGPCVLRPAWRRGPYEALVRAVMYQQLHGRAAAAILGRFIAVSPGEPFPSPATVVRIDETTLRAAGLSRQKIGYVRAIAEAALSGVVPVRRGPLLGLDDDAIIERLSRVRGVGRWTVEMLLIFTLGRLDVLPADDFGVRAGFARLVSLTGPISPRAMREAGVRWSPFRSVAAWYLWRAAEEP